MGPTWSMHCVIQGEPIVHVEISMSFLCSFDYISPG